MKIRRTIQETYDLPDGVEPNEVMPIFQNPPIGHVEPVYDDEDDEDGEDDDDGEDDAPAVVVERKK